MLTVGNLRDYVETDLSDVALQRLLDDAYGEIERRYGPETSIAAPTVTELFDGGQKSLFPPRPVASVTRITETVGTTDTDLAADDYEIRDGGRRIERRGGGTNSRVTWGRRVEVEYEPIPDGRDRVVIDLLKLAIRHEAVDVEWVGDTRTQYGDYTNEREKLIGSLRPSGIGLA